MLHLSPRYSLLAFAFAAGCSSGQTGDLGLGVGSTNEQRDTDLEPAPADAVDAAAASTTDEGNENTPEPDESAGSAESDAVETPNGEMAPNDGMTPNDETTPNDGVPSMTTETATPNVADAGASQATGDGNEESQALLPCEVLAADDLECVSAHSSVRRLVPGYDGPLYQLEQDGMTLDVGSVDGYADSAAHDEFCSSTECVISIVYDQSGMGNDLTPAPPGSAKATPGNPVAGSSLPVSINGHSAYGMLFRPGEGYRKLEGNGTAVGDEPQTVYMLTSQHDLINGCCFDYGNGSTTAQDDGNGTTEAVYFGMGVIWGTGTGEGPWVMADLENGLYPGWENGLDQNISTNTPLQHDFVTAILVGDTADQNGGRGRFALFGGDANQGTLQTMYDGIRPEKPGYVPMQKQGSVILGIASDNSDGDGGRFYEGVIANGAAKQDLLDALQAAIVDAAYGQ